MIREIGSKIKKTSGLIILSIKQPKVNIVNLSFDASYLS